MIGRQFDILNSEGCYSTVQVLGTVVYFRLHTGGMSRIAMRVYIPVAKYKVNRTRRFHLESQQRTDKRVLTVHHLLEYKVSTAFELLR
jgi:hypothetical protein